MGNWIRLLACLAATALCSHTKVAAQCGATTTCSCPHHLRVERSFTQGRWFVLESENFQICCEGSRTPAEHIARHAEALRKTLSEKWLANELDQTWMPKCQIVLYSSQSSYVNAVGRGGERTVGSSLVNAVNGRIASRRIDLLGSRTEYLSAALPHELTHVILKDRFPNKELPRWADEGTAILADSEAKQQRHYSDLRSGLTTGETFPAALLLTMEGYPPASQWGVFYGQSTSLVKFLVKRKTPDEFIRFIEEATAEGYDAALKKCYGIADARELDRQWRLDMAGISAKVKVPTATSLRRTKG